MLILLTRHSRGTPRLASLLTSTRHPHLRALLNKRRIHPSQRRNHIQSHPPLRRASIQTLLQRAQHNPLISDRGDSPQQMRCTARQSIQSSHHNRVPRMRHPNQRIQTRTTLARTRSHLHNNPLRLHPRPPQQYLLLTHPRLIRWSSIRHRLGHSHIPPRQRTTNMPTKTEQMLGILNQAFRRNREQIVGRPILHPVILHASPPRYRVHDPTTPQNRRHADQLTQPHRHPD